MEPVNTSQRHCEKSLDGHLAPQTKFVTIASLAGGDMAALFCGFLLDGPGSDN